MKETDEELRLVSEQQAEGKKAKMTGMSVDEGM